MEKNVFLFKYFIKESNWYFAGLLTVQLGVPFMDQNVTVQGIVDAQIKIMFPTPKPFIELWILMIQISKRSFIFSKSCNLSLKNPLYGNLSWTFSIYS